MSLPVHIYFHVLPVNHYQRLIDEVFQRNKELFRTAAKVVLSVNGDGPVTFPDVPHLTIVRNPNTFELPTLERIIADVQDGAPCYVLYLHTKGVTHTAWNQSLQDWLDYMLYFAIERAEDCIAALARHDTCGVELKADPYLHYSGNFWWARSDWLRGLPHPLTVPSAPFGDRHKCEFWVASQPGRHLALHESGISVYERNLHRYPPTHYRRELVAAHQARVDAGRGHLRRLLATAATPGAVLRIGLQRGPALAELATWLPESAAATAALLGCDPNTPQPAQVAAPGLTLLAGAPNAPESFARIAANGYRLVLDDGTHSSADVLLSFLNYFPFVNADGAYVVEGLLPEPGLGGPDALAFFRLLAERLVDDGPAVRSALLQLLSGLFPGQEEAVLARTAGLAAVEFRYEMVILRKSA